MTQVTQKSKTIYGLKARTTNENEMNPQTAKIAGLWGEFFTKVMPTLPQGTQGYGVYSNYESDAFGAFDVTTGSEVENSELEQITLAEGNYLCFKTKGELPQAVIDAWGEIWNYFADENCPDRRVFKTDYELYLSESEAEVYIGVE